MTWAVNVAAPFLLTACLLGSVQRRIVNVASISAASSIDFGNLQQVGGHGAGLWNLQQVCRHEAGLAAVLHGPPAGPTHGQAG